MLIYIDMSGNQSGTEMLNLKGKDLKTFQRRTGFSEKVKTYPKRTSLEGKETVCRE